MGYSHTLPTFWRSACAAAMGLVCASLSADDRGQGIEQNPAAESLELRDLRLALNETRAQLEFERARSQEIEERRQALVESLGEAVRVSEEQMAAAREVELKLQALGVDLLSSDGNSLDQRLLKAVRDLDIAEQEIERQRAVIHRLSETFLTVLKSQPDLAKGLKANAEAALAAADEVLAATAETTINPQDLTSAKVVSIDSGIGLVVFNAGRTSGIRVGTPITVLRDDRPLYSALIVDVRESLAGAVLQDRMADAGEVEVGDGIRFLPANNPL